MGSDLDAAEADGRGAGAKIRVLFMSASPSDLPQLQAEQEYRAVDARVQSARYRDRYALTYAPGVTAADFADTLQRHEPAIVHFSGHGTPDGELLLLDAEGRAAPVRREFVAEVFRALAADLRVRCVVLNACYSEGLAVALAEHVDCVIGMPSAMPERAAHAFSREFYAALGFGRSVEAAYRLGCSQVAGTPSGGESIPSLAVRRGVAPDAVRFAVRPREPSLQRTEPLAELGPALRRALPSADEIAALAARLERVQLDAEAFHRASRAAHADAPVAGTLDETVEHLAGFPTAVPVPKLAVFAHHVAASAGAGDARDQLLAWAAAHATRHGGDLAALDAHWRRLAAPSDDRHHLLAVVNEDDGGRFTLRAWIGREGSAEPMSPVPTRDEPVAVDQLASAIDDLLFEEPVFSLVEATGARLTVEIIAPLRDLLPATGGAFADAAFTGEHDVVLRWRERVYAAVKRAPRGMRPGLWRRKWDLLRAGASSWVSPSDPSLCDAAEQELTREGCVALALPPSAAGVPRERRLALLERALHQGLPVVTWRSDDDPATLSNPLTDGAPLEALARVRAARRGAAGDGRHLVLLWDDPDRLPPDASRDALLRAPQRT